MAKLSANRSDKNEFASWHFRHFLFLLIVRLGLRACDINVSKLNYDQIDQY